MWPEFLVSSTWSPPGSAASPQCYGPFAAASSPDPHLRGHNTSSKKKLVLISSNIGAQQNCSSPPNINSNEMDEIFFKINRNKKEDNKIKHSVTGSTFVSVTIEKKGDKNNCRFKAHYESWTMSQSLRFRFPTVQRREQTSKRASKVKHTWKIVDGETAALYERKVSATLGVLAVCLGSGRRGREGMRWINGGILSVVNYCYYSRI